MNWLNSLGTKIVRHKGKFIFFIKSFRSVRSVSFIRQFLLHWSIDPSVLIQVYGIGRNVELCPEVTELKRRTAAGFEMATSRCSIDQVCFTTNDLA